MLYGPTREQQEFRRALRGFLEKRAPETQLVGRVDGGRRFDQVLWRDMAEQLGLQGLAVPERFGGSGAGMVEQGFVFEELGRALTPCPYFATVALAANAILESGDEAAQQAHLPAISTGDRIATLAVTDRGPRTVADATGSRLTGTKTLVMDGDVAGLFVVDAGPALYLVAADAPGVSVRPLVTLDPARPLAELSLELAPATPLGLPGDAARVISRVLTLGRVALAAERLGGAERCLEIATEYAKDRRQFDRPIGSFQAVKHQLADVLCEVEAARSAVWYAAWAAEESSEELDQVEPAASHISSEAFLRAAQTCVHVLGGIGFTWEHPAHLFFKRATSSAYVLGSPTQALQRLADEVL